MTDAVLIADYKKTLRTAPGARLRAGISRGMLTLSRAGQLNAEDNGAQQIDREGGDEGAGVIRGTSVITIGEALGHDLWVDQTFLEQVAHAINETGDRGLKSRFTHPGVSGDALGTYLGRHRDAENVGDSVYLSLIHI